MQLNIIEASSPDVFEYIIYPQAHANTYQYLQNQFSNISTIVMDAGRKFFEEGQAAVEKFVDGTIDRAARATLRMAKNLINPNAIQRYDSPEDIQAASPLMQRYIMSEPYIREKYLKQQCSGYAGMFIDNDPGFLREKNYDWRRVNNGIIHFEGEGDDERWVSRNFFEDLREGDSELNFDQKVDILHAQGIARAMAEAGIDPTNPYGGEIG